MNTHTIGEKRCCRCNRALTDGSYAVSNGSKEYCFRCAEKGIAVESKVEFTGIDGAYDEPEDTCSALDTQVGGGHYKDFEIQPVEFIHKNNIGFLEGNCIKYLCRH